MWVYSVGCPHNNSIKYEVVSGTFDTTSFFLSSFCYISYTSYIPASSANARRGLRRVLRIMGVCPCYQLLFLIAEVFFLKFGTRLHGVVAADGRTVLHGVVKPDVFQ